MRLKLTSSILLIATAINVVGQVIHPFSFYDQAWGAQNVFSGLVAYWKLEETTGNSRVSAVGSETLAELGAATSSGTGIHNTAADALNENSNERLEHADDATLGAGSGVSFTFVLWIKPNNSTGANNPIMAKWDLTHFDYIAAFVSPNFVWEVRNGANNAFVLVTGTPPANGTFHQVVVGYDDPNQLLFMQIDGGARTNIACVGVQRTVAAFDLFNYSYNTSAFNYRGFIDEVGLWKRPLSVGEVNYLWNGGSGRFLP